MRSGQRRFGTVTHCLLCAVLVCGSVSAPGVTGTTDAADVTGSTGSTGATSATSATSATGAKGATGATDAAQADGFDAMRTVWKMRSIGGAAKPDDPDIVAAIEAQQRHGARLLKQMRLEPNTAMLWDNAGRWDDPYLIAASATVTSHYRNIHDLARSWATPGTPLFHDAQLLDAVLFGLAWMEKHHYHAGKAVYGNWWDWQIGAPLQLVNTLVLMDDAVPPYLLARCLAAVDFMLPDPRQRARPDGGSDQETGANLLDKVLIVALRGVLGKSAQKVEQARAAVSLALPYVRSGDGFYKDGSFVQHTHVAYTGSYGVVVLEDLARLVSLFASGPSPIRDPRMDHVYVWLRDSYVPLIYDGAMVHTVRGRRVVSPGQHDHAVGRGVAAAVAELAQTAPPALAQQLRAAIKGWMTRDKSFGRNYFAAAGGRVLALHEIGLLKAIVADPGIEAAPEPLGVRLFPAMDRAMLRGPGFGLAFSLFSPRISAYESGNHENPRGWWTGIGMTSLYNADQNQFSGNFWATVDAQRLPGITTDHSAKGALAEWKKYANSANWSGGAALDNVGVLGMAFRMDGVTGSDLRGNKAWFMFGDKVLALGSGIRASAPVETIVENRKLAGAGDQVLLVDGQPAAVQPGQPQVFAAAHWAHLAGNVPGAAIGYCFPLAQAVTVLRERRSGRWSDINGLSTSPVVSDNYVSLALPHQQAAKGQDSYSYLLVPGASAAQTSSYCGASGVRVQENTEAVAAASDAGQGLFGAALWQGGQTAHFDNMPLLHTDRPAALLLREQAGHVTIGIADPSHVAASVTVELLRPAAELLQHDPGVEVLQMAPTLRLRVHTSDAMGRTFLARVRLAHKTVVFPAISVK